MLLFSLKQIRKHFARSIIQWSDAGTGLFALTINTISLVLAWIFVPLERGYWQDIRANRKKLYPHVNFEKPTASDVIRIFLQSLLLCLVQVFSWNRFKQDNPLARFVRALVRGVERLGEAIGALGTKLLAGVGKTLDENAAQDLETPSSSFSRRLQKLLIRAAALVVAALAVLCITQPFDIKGQVIFLSIMLFSAWSFTHVRARVTLMVLFVISVTVSGRYLWWRCTSTINASAPLDLFLSLLLLAAEIYAFIVMVLGYFQVCWVLDRKPCPMPQDRAKWPTVDIFIPTYNESLEVIKPTVFAALNLDWPKEKLRVHLLDDGSRDAFAEFAANCSAADVEGVYNAIRLPERATTGSAGYDFYAPYDFSVAPGEEVRIATGIRAEISEGWVLAIFPRSGLGFKYRLMLNNTVGVIDSDYYRSDNEGHIHIKLYNGGGKRLEVASGEAFAQGIFLPFGITSDDSVTAIRNGGFGSTTKK